MFQGIQQGTSLYILYRNEPRVVSGNIVNVTGPKPPKASQGNPMAAFGGLVMEATVSTGNDTTSFEIPVNATTANYPDKGIFISTDRTAVVREVESMANMSKQILSQVPMHQKMVTECDNLLLELNPEKQKEVQTAKEMADLKGELADMKRMLSAFLANKDKKEE